MVEASFNVMDYLGKSLNELKGNKVMKKQVKDDKGKLVTVACEFSEIVTKTGNPKGTFHNCKERGLSVFTLENSDLVEFVTLYNESVDKFQKYQYKLPYGLSLEVKNQEIVRKFGDSKEKGGGSIPIWINFEHLGI